MIEVRSHLTPLLAEVDISQVIVVIVFLVVGFLNWLINLWKQKREAAERARNAPTAEQEEARRRAWEEQTREIEAQSERRPESPPIPSTGGSLKDLFEELKKAAQEAQSPPPPPPRPQPSPRPVLPPAPSHRLHPPPPLPVSALARERDPMALTAPAVFVAQTHDNSALQASHAYDTKAERRRGSHPITALLHTSIGYQQAFILKEILDTPKGIRNTPWDSETY